MKITSAIPIFTFVGFLNFKYAGAVTVGLVRVQMENHLWFNALLLDAMHVPSWRENPKKYPEQYRAYQIFIRMRDGKIYISDALIHEKGLTPNQHEPLRDRPMDFVIRIHNLVFLRSGIMEMYNPASPPNLEVDRMFITVKNTALIYTAAIVLSE
ncbi:uncharacterized protein LOC117167850 isoform X2 [Belonocnema kinseyi]|uniref:uncharacterized protein LOC117167850 isoform X2 n=1 Tax=Belonocnema kinseyi TaxID=2817044 RepID=UPI00143DCAE6|nr:uncharacterized protein LOC117167850 isoform X2 [Belonocnema kinseyi]